MTPQPVKIRADVELTCFQYDGIEHIKAAMRAAEAQGTEVRGQESLMTKLMYKKCDTNGRENGAGHVGK